MTWKWRQENPSDVALHDVDCSVKKKKKKKSCHCSKTKKTWMIILNLVWLTGGQPKKEHDQNWVNVTKSPYQSAQLLLVLLCSTQSHQCKPLHSFTNDFYYNFVKMYYRCWQDNQSPMMVMEQCTDQSWPACKSNSTHLCVHYADQYTLWDKHNEAHLHPSPQ